MPTDKSRLERIFDKLSAFDRLYSSQLSNLDLPCDHGVADAHLNPSRCALCSINYVQYCIDNDIKYDRTIHAYLFSESILKNS